MITYMLSYDPLSVAPISDQLSAFIKANKHVEQWLHPYSGCYLLKSNTPLFTISESFRQFLGHGRLHIITPIGAPMTGGILPQFMWDWVSMEPQTLSGLLSHYSGKT